MDDPQARQSRERRPHAPGRGICRVPWSLVGEDVRPRLFAQHEEHQYVEQPQQVNVDPADTFVSFVPLKNVFQAYSHGNILKVTACLRISLSAINEPRSIRSSITLSAADPCAHASACRPASRKTKH